jgi:hypothetical protein
MNRLLWLLFLTLNVSTWLVSRLAWMSGWCFDAQGWLAAGAGAVALALIGRGFRSKRDLLLLVIGLLAGQWPVWSRYLAIAVWRTRGFAP